MLSLIQFIEESVPPMEGVPKDVWQAHSKARAADARSLVQDDRHSRRAQTTTFRTLKNKVAAHVGSDEDKQMKLMQDMTAHSRKHEDSMNESADAEQALHSAIKAEGGAGLLHSMMSNDEHKTARSLIKQGKVIKGNADTKQKGAAYYSVNEAFTDERRCTGSTINAIAGHHGVPGIEKGSDAPRSGAGVDQHLSKHLKTKHNYGAIGKTVQNFVSNNPTGTHYISTNGHAMAVVDGKLHDTSGRGPDKRKVQFAAEYTKRD